MVAKKRKKIEKLSFYPIEGLEHSIAEIYEKEEEIETTGECRPASDYKYLESKWPYNPMQSSVLPYFDKDVNLILSAKTSAGKSLVLECIAAHTLSLGKKTVYICPQKALGQEKLEEWKDVQHALGKTGIAILSGDYTRTASYLKNVNECGIIICTIELFDSILRTYNPENPLYNFVKEIGFCAIDEAHLLSTNRGSKLEASLIRIAEIVPSAKMALVSGTLANGASLQKWIQELTGRETILHESKFRPTALTRFYVRYHVLTTDKEAKKELTQHFMKMYSDEGFLIFVGSKKYGHSLESDLKKEGIDARFFKADLSLEERNKMYQAFDNREFKTLVSTPSLAAGCNLPCRNVVVSDMKFGIHEPVPSAMLNQQAGRAGRKNKDPFGRCFFLIRDTQWKVDFPRIEAGEMVLSQLSDFDTIAFHILANINSGQMQNPKQLIQWYEKTLARSQASRGMEMYEAKTVFERLLRCCCITDNPEKAGDYLITKMGNIAAIFYLLPEDIFALRCNFDKFFATSKADYRSQKDYEMAFCQCLAQIPTWKEKNKTFVSSEEMAMAKSFFGIHLATGTDKVALCYYLLLNNDLYKSACEEEKKVRYFNLIMESIKNDSERLISALSLLDVRTKRWSRSDFWSLMTTRLMYGVPECRLELCSVESVGGARSKQLYDNGIRTVKDMVNNEFKVKEILGDKVAETAMQSARVLHSANQIGW